MKRILILGGTGYTGRLIVRHLLERSEAAVTVAARSVDKCHVLAAEMNQRFHGERAAAVFANAADAASLREAFRGQDLVVVAAPTTAHAGVVTRTALEAGADYLDVQLGAGKFALLQSLAGEIQRTGRCFITEAGYHPGLPAALVRHAAARLDSIESAITAGYLNLGKDLPYSEAVDELVELFREYPSQVYQNGQWTAAGSFKMRKIDFSGDIGRKRCYPMFLEELRPLPEMFPSLREAGFYISEMHWMTDWIITPLAMAVLKLSPRASRPMGKLIWWGMGTFHKPPYRVELQVQAAGVKDGKRIHIRAGVAHADGYELTAIPVAAALLQYLDGSARKPGLWMMGHMVEPDRLLADMQKMGVQFLSEIG